MKVPSTRSITLWALPALLAAGCLFGQNPGVNRNIVHKSDVSFPNHEAVVARVEVDPGASAGKHTHPGDEISYVMEGEGEIMVEGRPTIKVHAGDGLVIPAGSKHDVKNTGTRPLKVVAVYVVEKGKALVVPVK